MKLDAKLEAAGDGGDNNSNSSSEPDLFVADYVYFFVQALEAEITDRHPFLVEAVDQSQPIAETLMLTFANLTQVIEYLFF